MSEFDFRRVFDLDEGFGTRLEVSVTFSNDTKEPLSVLFSDPYRDQMVSVPFDLWKRVVDAVNRNLDY